MAAFFFLLSSSAYAEEAEVRGIDIDAAIAALAEDAPDLGFVLFVRLIEQRGYTIESITTTLLGRVRIVALNSYHRRETIISRASGQILRDTLVDVFAEPQGQPALPPLPTGYFMFPRVGAYPEVPN